MLLRLICIFRPSKKICLDKYKFDRLSRILKKRSHKSSFKNNEIAKSAKVSMDLREIVFYEQVYRMLLSL